MGLKQTRARRGLRVKDLASSAAMIGGGPTDVGLDKINIQTMNSAAAGHDIALGGAGIGGS